MIEKIDLAEQAYQAIKTMIIEGKLKPAEPLHQEDLARKLGISRTPIIHALKVLEAEGIVSRNSRQNIKYVRDLTPEELITLFEIRSCIEPLVARYACKVISDESVEELKSAFTKAYMTKDETEYRRVDNKFHTFLVEICPNRDLKDMAVRSGIIFRFLIKGLIRPPEETYSEHMKILSALREKHPSEAESSMEEHIKKTLIFIKTQNQ